MPWTIFCRAREQDNPGIHLAELRVEFRQEERELEVCGCEFSGSGARGALEEIVTVYIDFGGFLVGPFRCSVAGITVAGKLSWTRGA